MSEARRDIMANLRGALIEAKESIESKRKLNTPDNLISDLRTQTEPSVYIRILLEIQKDM